MKKQLGLLALAAVMGLGLTQSGFGQGPPAGTGPGQRPAVQNVGPGGSGAGIGFYCPFRQAGFTGTAGASTLGAGWRMGRGMRRSAAFAPGSGPFCPFRSNAAVTSGTAVTGSNTAGFVPGMGMRRNAPVAPGMGPFCPFNSNNSATTAQQAGTTTQPGTASGSTQPATK
jgi:hypothetical protein